MERKIKAYTFSGTTAQEPRDYEAVHRQIARRAAADGMVLLKNEDGFLPFKEGTRLALYGAGAVATIKGGTGSGDVNSRETVNVYEGLKAAGFTIVSEDWIEGYKDCYRKAREQWREEIWKDEEARTAAGEPEPMFNAYASHQFELPAGALPTPVESDAAIYVIARIAGEAKDRTYSKGDYLLSDEETEALKTLCAQQERVLVVINSGGLIDLSFMDELPQIKGLIYMGQPGMEAGHALADILSGAVTPSAKLTDSWPYHYEDYPNADTFSHRSGDTSVEHYGEGIYVGYRYFDTFEVPVRYSFGFGLSYTSFALRMVHLSFIKPNSKWASVRIVVEVTNTGTVSGKEVVQIYVSSPQKNVFKEYRRLVGFTKSGEIAPGKFEDVEIIIPIYSLASYSDKEPGWQMDCGTYGFFMGNSLESAKFSASVELTKHILLTKTEHICTPKEEIKELECPRERVLARRAEWHGSVYKNPAIVVPTEMLLTSHYVRYGVEDKRIAPEIWKEVDALSTEQMIQLVTGDPGKAQGALGAAGNMVPGSAAETSACAVDKGVASIVLADGPAGLRLTKTYYVKDGNIQQFPFAASIENGYLCRSGEQPEGEAYYQYCTAFPVGMQLAQSWDLNLVEEVGKAVAEELKEFGVTLWLAPGMNIHRNPLCGRNFEYYSEDPLLSGRLAGAMTKGVQEDGGVGTTIKHFACNNQEDNRMGSDSVLSERALREIYLKGFEHAVVERQPWSIMTSYNLVNGIHAANNYDLCTKAARDEWGFEGVIMTDWTTTHHGEDCTASGCIRAGNDLVMPGIPNDHENIRKALEDGSLTIGELRRAVAHILAIVFKSDSYEVE